jgi:nucleotide-binding universal stress UspA family protein
MIRQPDTRTYSLLVPMDGSASALRALDAAMAVVRDHPGARILLLNAQPPLLEVWPEKLVDEDMRKAHYEREARAALIPAEKILGAASIPYHSEVRVGPVAATIADFAAERGCRRIVMGTRGMGNLQALVIGSVAVEVVHRATMPVTLVK